MALGESAEGSVLLIYQPALAQRCSLENPGAARGTAEMAECRLTGT